jgi:hypothetical protein
MNKSFSKIRHIRQANLMLEQRIREQEEERYERRIPDYLEGTNPAGKRDGDKIKQVLSVFINKPKEGTRKEFISKINSNKKAIQKTLIDIYKEVKNSTPDNKIETNRDVDVDSKVAKETEISDYDMPAFGEKSDKKLKDILLNFYSKFLWAGTDDLSAEQKITISRNKKNIMNDIKDYIGMYLWIDEEGEQGNWGLPKNIDEE